MSYPEVGTLAAYRQAQDMHRQPGENASRFDLELLRRAAELMLTDSDKCWHAVAAWLDTGVNPYACVDRDPMLAVAVAYLREDA